jgi:dCTP deaminase
MFRPGVQPDHVLRSLMRNGVIGASEAMTSKQLQPASIDLRLGARAYRVPASFLPGPHVRVQERLSDFTLHTVDLSQGAVLETGCVYVAEILEHLTLPPGLRAEANPKSSTGRIDVLTRVIADGAQAFDTISHGYHGPLYVEIAPRTFPILVRQGSCLGQLRFIAGSSRVTDSELLDSHADEPLIQGRDNPLLRDGLLLRIALGSLDDQSTPGSQGSIIGYRARSHTGLIDVDRVQSYAWTDFWEPLAACVRGGRNTLLLEPGAFYILASKEEVSIPANYAATMVPFDPLVGEFRAHYAGFFDPGFGHSAHTLHTRGARAVLEVRPYDIPFLVEDGQVIARLCFEKMADTPERLYGTALASHYQAQGLALSKHFITQ